MGNKNYSSWSLRPWVLMKHLGLPFEERVLQLDTAQFAQEIAALSPTRRVPILRHGALLVWDSLAIVEYLAERHHGVWPVEAKARSWARSAAAEMHSSFTALRNMCPMSCGLRVKPFPMSDALKHDIFRLGDLWNDGFARFGGHADDGRIL